MSGPPIWSITIRGEPVPASRPRFDSRTKRAYTSSRYANWKRAASMLCTAQWRCCPIQVAVAVCVEVTLPRPKHRPASGSLHHRYWHPTEDYPLPLRGDVDNYGKAALDALVQGGVLKDDDLVVELTATKCAGSVPSVEIQISLVEPEQADVFEAAK